MTDEERITQSAATYRPKRKSPMLITRRTLTRLRAESYEQGKKDGAATVRRVDAAQRYSYFKVADELEAVKRELAFANDRIARLIHTPESVATVLAQYGPVNPTRSPDTDR